MGTKKFLRIFIAALALVVTSLACGQSGGAPAAQPTAKPKSTATATVKPTSTKQPTSTPKPTATPNIAATQAMENANTKIQSYVDAGYMTSAEGELVVLDDYFREMAKMNYLDYDPAGYDTPIKNFAVWAHIKMQSARKMSGYEYSGCGFTFRLNPKNFDGYTVHLTDSSILMSYCDSSIHRCGRLGTTRGKGVVEKLPNPAEANLEMVVNNTQAYVLVDGQFIGEYSLFTEKLLDPGYLAYSIISGTNAEYGTRCEVTDAQLWVSK